MHKWPLVERVRASQGDKVSLGGGIMQNGARVPPAFPFTVLTLWIVFNLFFSQHKTEVKSQD